MRKSLLNQLVHFPRLFFILLLCLGGWFSCIYGQGNVDCRFLPNEIDCSIDDAYCANIQIKGNNGADHIGISSVRIAYNPDVLTFHGSSNGTMNQGSYTPLNFSQNDGSIPEIPLAYDCTVDGGGIGASPYAEQGFDGLFPGDLLTTVVLQAPSIDLPDGPLVFACPGIAADWMDVYRVCFEVIDPNGDPDLSFVGVENGLPGGDESGTNFNNAYNDPSNKYLNGTFFPLNTPYNELCGLEVSGCSDPNACNYHPLATVDSGDCEYGMTECPDPCNAILGCTNPLADNYDAMATCDDNSCLYTQAVDFYLNVDDNGLISVSLVPDVTWAGVQGLTATAQVSLIVPSVGFELGNLTSVNGEWSNNSTIISPSENPGFDYVTIGLVSLGTQDIDYVAGQEELLFTFENVGECVETIGLVLENDPFSPPNSQNANVGNKITTLGGGNTNSWSGANDIVVFDCPEFGCTDVNACNYDALASTDNGTCVYSIVNCTCGDITGCTDVLAYNYNSSASCDDGSCEYSVSQPGDPNENDNENQNLDGAYIDSRFVGNPNACSTSDDYCAMIQIKGEGGADLLGTSSIRFSYDFNVLSFSGTGTNGTTVGNYTSINFDGDQNTLHPQCEAGFGITPYSEQGYDGLTPGDVLMTFVLLNPTIGTVSFACPGTAGEWTDVAEICFEVLDPTGDPNIHFEGIENGDSSGDPTGTNFSTDLNDPTNKYLNGNFQSLNTSYNVLCGLGSDIEGCTDANACNYNPDATINSGCVYGVAGCPDPCNAILDCTNSEAVNYNPLATCDDGSCIILGSPGCTDPTACNYNSQATEDNGGCEYPVTGCACGDVLGCTNITAVNYNSAATCDDGSCLFVGCTDPQACNYNAAATLDDGTCVYPNQSCACGDVLGCTDPSALNYNPLATCDDGTCSGTPGCTDPQACNYNAAAVINDGTCTYAPGGCNCGDVVGCTNPCAINYNPIANCDSGNCLYDFESSAYGCTDPTAINYSAAAICDNGTCEYNNNDHPVFNDYPWLPTTGFDPNNCTNEIITVYNSGIYSFIYVETENGNTLYFEDGTLYCSDTPTFSCVEAYGLVSIESSWVCENPTETPSYPEVFTDYPWILTLINPNNCTDETITVYQEGIFYFLHIDGSLYFQDGTFYCADSPGYSCVEAYGFSNVIGTWSCGDEMPNQGDIQVFHEYPWLGNVVNPNNCTDEMVIVYTTGNYEFVFIDGTLYFEDGTFYCADSPGYSCVNAYGLTEVVSIWSCADSPVIDPVFSDYPWLDTVVDPNNCNGQTVNVHFLAGYHFVHIIEQDGLGTLYFEDGTYYCADAIGFSCLEIYLLTAPPIASWTCGLGKAEQMCTNLLTPITVCHNLEDRYQIEDVIQLEEKGEVQIVNESCFRYTPLVNAGTYQELVLLACDLEGNCQQIQYNIVIGDCQNDVVEESETDNEERYDALIVENFTLYPNPSNGQVFVKILTHSNLKQTINVFDVTGNPIAQKEISAHSEDTNVELNLTDLPAGFYLVEVKTAYHSAVKRLVIE